MSHASVTYLVISSVIQFKHIPGNYKKEEMRVGLYAGRFYTYLVLYKIVLGCCILFDLKLE